MNYKKKLTVSFIFMAGFLVTGISIARYVLFEKASEANFTCKLPLYNSRCYLVTIFVPILDDFVGVGILSIAEVDVSIVRFRSLLCYLHLTSIEA